MADSRLLWTTVRDTARLYALDTNTAALSTSQADALILGNRLYQALYAAEPRIVIHDAGNTGWQIGTAAATCLSDDPASGGYSYQRIIEVYRAADPSAAVPDGAGAFLTEVWTLGKTLRDLESTRSSIGVLAAGTITACCVIPEQFGQWRLFANRKPTATTYFGCVAELSPSELAVDSLVDLSPSSAGLMAILLGARLAQNAGRDSEFIGGILSQSPVKIAADYLKAAGLQGYGSPDLGKSK